MTGPQSPESPSPMRVFAGLLIQPPVSAIAAFLLFPYLLLDSDGRTIRGGYPADVTDAAASVALGAGMIAGALMVVLLPVVFWLASRPRPRPSLPTMLLIGVGLGNLPYVGMLILAGFVPWAEALLRGVAFSSLLGVVGATVFWAVALWTHWPDVFTRGARN